MPQARARSHFQEKPLSATLSVPSVALADLQAAIGRAFFSDETPTVNALIEAARLAPEQTAHIGRTAEALVAAVREEQAASGTMQSFLHQYDLSSQEGVLLMCVAEALLRIPDAATADRLIRDKFSRGEPHRHGQPPVRRCRQGDGRGFGR